MGIETDLNVNPYYDDFDETKDFHRVLFKPAVPLQARELTQLQTILQNQVEKFGQFTFKEGSIVKGCTFTYERNIKYVKILDKATSGLDVNVNLFSEGDFIRNSTNLVSRVVDTAGGLETQNPDLNTLFFNYVNTSNTTPVTKEYIKGEDLDIFPASTEVESVVFTGIPNDVFLSNNDTISLTSNLKGTGFSGHVVTVDQTNQYQSVNVTANGTGFSVDDLPTATIVAANGGVFTNGTSSSNTTFDFAAALANGTITATVNLKKTDTVTVGTSTLEDTTNTQFNVLGSAFQMKVGDGVIFQKGTFQRFAEQDIIVSKYTNRPNELTVGVATTESFVNSSVDTSLLDNASGFANENAPGADRLKLQPVLVVNTIPNATSSNNFLKLVEFQYGMPVKMNSDAQLSGLGEILEQRLYETSGDYVLEPLALGTEEQLSNGTHFTVVTGAGVGYNKGKRFEIISPVRTNVPKAQTFITATDQEVSINFGNYVEVDNFAGSMGHTTNDRVLLMDTALTGHQKLATENFASNSVCGVTTAGVVTYGGTTATPVGHARVRSVQQQSADASKGNCVYRVYLYDIVMNKGKSFARHARSIFHYSANEYTGDFAQVNQGSISTPTAITKRGMADLVLNQGRAVIKEQTGTDRDLLFPLGQVGIKQISNDADYVFQKVAETEFETTGNVQITTVTSQRFNFGTAGSGTDGLSELQENEIHIIPTETVLASDELDTSATTSTSSNVISTLDTTDIFEGDFISVRGSDNASANTEIYEVIKKSNNKVQVDRNVDNIASASDARIRIAYPHGRPISLRNRSTAKAITGAFNTISPAGQTLEIKLGRNLQSKLGVDIIFDAVETNGPGIIKNYNTSDVIINQSNNVAGNSGPWCLGIPDGHKLVSVHVSANSTNITGASVATGIGDGTLADKTSEFELLNGQEGSKYGFSKLKLKDGSSFSPGDATIAVKFRHFGIASGSGYSSFQSYAPVISDTTFNATTTINTEEIPVFVSNISGREYSLRDVIDFRPYVTSTANVAGTFAGANVTTNPSTSEAIVQSTLDTPTPNKSWSASSIQYYLPRKDRLIIEDGNLHVVRGKPSTSPELPPKPTNGMQLGTIDIPVYPSLDAASARITKRPDLGVKIKTTQLKRYTMKDIKKIDNRVNNLEYYTSLNLLESQTADESIPSRSDPTISRFKNGFIVDNFVNYSTGNPLNTEFKAGFDIARKTLMPRFEQLNLKLKFDLAKKAFRTGDTFTLDHGYRQIMEQPEATQSRRCVSAYWQYNGDVQLYPDYLNNVDVEHVPEAQITIDIDTGSGIGSLLEELNKIVPIQSTTDEVIEETETTTSINVEESDGVRTETFETITEQKIERTTKGLGVDYKNTEKVVGEYVTNIAFQPYIPGIDIRFVATGLRPNLRHYVFFDDAAVSGDCAPAEIVNTINPAIDELQLLSTDRSKKMIYRKGAFGSALTADASGTIIGIFRIPANKFHAGERKFAIVDVTNLSQIKETVSAASTKFNCFNFKLEKGSVTTNTREAVISDRISSDVFSISNTTTFDVVTTIPGDDEGGGGDDGGGGDGDLGGGNDDGDPWRDIGDCEPVIEDLWDLDEGGRGQDPRPRFRPCDECPPAYLQDLRNRGITRHTRHDLRENLSGLEFFCAQYVDPLAQSFLIQPEMFDGSPSGYLRRIDLYFAQKHSTLGCIVEIREVTNGLPDNKVLPFSRVHVKSSSIQTSTDGETATKVYFKGPVAVDTNKEYAFVIKPVANNPETQIFTAKAGQSSLKTGVAINQDWGDGTMFLSSNDRTWTPYTDEDAKFKLFAAHFNTSSGGVRLTNDDYEFVKATSAGVTGTFKQGEELFVEVTSDQSSETAGNGKNKRQLKANVTFSAGNNTVTAGTDEDLSNFVSGDRITLKNANNQFDVVEVDSAVASKITLRGAPDITETTADAGTVTFAPSGTYEQFDANTNTLVMNDSTSSNSNFMLAAGDKIIGAQSNASIIIDTIENTNISYFEPRFYNNIPNRTSISSKMKARQANNAAMSSFDRVKTNDRNFPDEPLMVKSKTNEISGTTVTKSLVVDHNMTTANRYVAPFVDLQSQSILIYENMINNSTTNEYLSGKGQADAKYVSRIVTLGDELDAEDIKVFVNAYKPAGTDIKVYAKAVNQADEVNFADGTWSELQRTKNNDKVSSSENRRDVIEYGFEFKDAPASTAVTGIATFTNNTTTINGVGTNFDGDFAVGDLVKIDNPPFDANTNYQISMVTAIASDTQMTIADNIELATENDGRTIFRVNDADKNTIFRDPQSNVDSLSTPFIATYYNTNNEKFVGYKYLAIKIVMTATSTSLTPYCEDFRAIAVSL